MSIRHLIPEKWLFQNLTWKIKCQGHVWGHSLKSQCVSNILSTHIPFTPCQPGTSFLSYDFFKSWPSKSRFKVMGECHSSKSQSGSIILSTHIPFAPCHSALAFLRHCISKYDLENPWSMSNHHNVGQLQVQTIPKNFELYKSIQWFQRYGFRNVWTQLDPNLTSIWPMGKPLWGKWSNKNDSAQLQP